MGGLVVWLFEFVNESGYVHTYLYICLVRKESQGLYEVHYIEHIRDITCGVFIDLGSYLLSFRSI